MKVLKARKVKAGTKAKGKEPPRTMRMRFIEPPSKPDGNPIFALRCEPGLLKAFRALAAKRKLPATALARQLMADAAGYKLVAEESEPKPKPKRSARVVRGPQLELGVAK